MRRVMLFVTMVILALTDASGNGDILLYKVDNSKNLITTENIAFLLEQEGYEVAKNQDMNTPYERQFKKSSFKIYSLMSIYHPEVANESVLKYSESGLFVPFSIAIYQRKNEDSLYIALLSSKAKEKILNVIDPMFSRLEAHNRVTIKKILPKAVEVKFDYKPIKTDEKLYTKYSFEVDDDEALESYEDFKLMLTEGMKPSGFVVANYIDFNKELKVSKHNDYLFYDSYSLCKLKIIYELSKTKPEAGAFAPCTMVIYHKKGSNKTELVSLNINNLTSTLALQDKSLLKMLEKAQKDMTKIIEDASE